MTNPNETQTLMCCPAAKGCKDMECPHGLPHPQEEECADESCSCPPCVPNPGSRGEI